MRRNVFKILFACDLHSERPWVRDRIPGIEAAISRTRSSVIMRDFYALLGQYEFSPSEVEYRERFLQNENILVANETFFKNVKDERPDILVLGTADNYRHILLPSTLEQIRSIGIYTVGILGDDEFNYGENQFLLNWFNMYMVYVKSSLEMYNKISSSEGYFLPNSCHIKSLDKNIQSQDNTYFDAVLIGAPIANRPELIKGLIESGMNIAIYGSRKWMNYDFAVKSYKGFVESKRFDEVLSRSKIVLAFLEDHITGQLHMNTKIWEAVRVGRLPIATYYDPLFKDYLLEESVTIVTYQSQAELIEKVKYYSQNDDQREKIVKRLRSHVKECLDYQILYANFFGYLDRKLRENYSDHNDTQNLKENNFKSGSLENVWEGIHEHIKIISEKENNKIEYIFYNSIEKNLLVRPIWPFIPKYSVIRISPFQLNIGFFHYIKLLFFKRSMYVNQIIFIRDNRTLCGSLSRLVRCMYFKYFKIR